MRLSLIALVSVLGLSACGGEECEGSECDESHSLTFEPFNVQTASVGTMYLSLSDSPMSTACGLAQGRDLELGVEGRQILAGADMNSLWTCDDTSIALRNDCDPEPTRGGGGGGATVIDSTDDDRGCAWFRAWDEDGDSRGEVAAVAGNISYGPNGFSDCLFEVEVIFRGGDVFQHSFLIEDWDDFSDLQCAQ